jgi:hypothetical protein
MKSDTALLYPREEDKVSRKTLVMVLLVAFALITTDAAFAQQRWSLVETSVNPNNDLLEYYGGGTTPGYYTDARYEGKYQIYTVTSTRFSVQDKDVDRDYVYYDVILTTDFTSPPSVLTPGDTVSLTANFSSSGTVNSGRPGVLFWYTGDGVSMTPSSAFSYSPWSPEYAGISSTTYSFVVPNTHSGEIKIYASWWNTPGTLVVWKYQAADVSDSECTVDIRGADISGTLAVDEQITFTVEATNDCNGQIYYKWFYHPDYGTSNYDGLQWSSMTSSQWITADNCTYSFSEAGDYIVVVWAVADTSNIPDALPTIGFSVTIKEDRQ